MPKNVDSSQVQMQSPSEASKNGSPADSMSSNSTSSLSDSGHGNLVTRSQLYKRPPRFKVQPSRELLTYAEEVQDSEDVTQEVGHDLPFTKVSRTSQVHSERDTVGRDVPTPNEQHDPIAFVQQNDPSSISRTPAVHPVRAHETSSSTTSSVNEIMGSGLHDTDTSFPKHHQDLSRTNIRSKVFRAKKEGSEGTPSMGSSFSDIDGTYSLDLSIPRKGIHHFSKIRAGILHRHNSKHGICTNPGEVVHHSN